MGVFSLSFIFTKYIIKPLIKSKLPLHAVTNRHFSTLEQTQKAWRRSWPALPLIKNLRNHLLLFPTRQLRRFWITLTKKILQQHKLQQVKLLNELDRSFENKLEFRFWLDYARYFFLSNFYLNILREEKVGKDNPENSFLSYFTLDQHFRSVVILVLSIWVPKHTISYRPRNDRFHLDFYDSNF